MHEIIDFLSNMVLWFVVYSFDGWAYETVLVSVQQKRFVNRGFLNGPLCPIYGCGAVMAAVLLPASWPDWAVFTTSAVAACLLEYVTSIVMEEMFHARWWDYSSYKFNYQGRVCLLGFIVFGVAGLAIVEYAQPALETLTAMLPSPWRLVIAVVASLAVIIDFIVSIVGTYGLDKTAGKLREVTEAMEDSKAARALTALRDNVHVPTSVANKAARLGELASKTMNSQQKRMLASFPRLRFTAIEDGFTTDLKTAIAGRWHDAVSKIDRPSAGIEVVTDADGKQSATGSGDED